MKNNKSFILSLLLLGLGALSCNPKEMGTEYSVTSGHWGHLTSITKTGTTKMYLSHVKKNETYKVCLSSQMTEKYPGIKSEVKAAINIWGHYIGRKIKVEIVEASMPELGPEDDEIKAMNEYYKQCPKDVHLVMGETFFTDFAVGKTQTSYSYYPKNGKQEVVSFQRALFLKASPDVDEYSVEDEDRVVWKSLAQALGKELSEDEIIEMMLKRDQKIYLSGKDELLTFKTIVHEFGHVWGMCDQYAIDGYTTNCDGKFATLDNDGHILLHDEAMMAKSSWIAKLYLTDDDIEGIRRLAERPEFAHDWQKSAAFRRIKAPEITEAKAIPVAILNSAKMDGMELNLNMSIVTTVTPVILSARIMDKNIKSWIQIGDITFKKAMKTKDYTLNVALGKYYSPEKVEVTLRTGNRPEDEKVVLKAEVVHP